MSAQPRHQATAQATDITTPLLQVEPQSPASAALYGARPARNAFNRTESHHEFTFSGQLHTVPSLAALDPHRVAAARANRAKTAVPRRCMTWSIITADGCKYSSNADKRTIAYQEGLRMPLRDMRSLDPARLSAADSAQLLVRENVIAVIMEHVRVIITADKVLVPVNAEGSRKAAEFLQTLEMKLMHRSSSERPMTLHDGDDDFSGSESYSLTESIHLPLDDMDTQHGCPYSTLQQHAQHTAHANNHHHNSIHTKHNASGLHSQPSGQHHYGAHAAKPPNHDAMHVAPYDEKLPFELEALEIALQEVCSGLAEEVERLLARTRNAVEALTRVVNKHTLECVRQVKTAHQRLSGRVSGVREQLEKYLDDDEDLWKFCLGTRKTAEEDPNSAAATAIMALMGGGLMQQQPHPVPHADTPNRGAAIHPGMAMGSSRRQSVDGRRHSTTLMAAAEGAAPEMLSMLELHNEIEDVENLLEAYYVKIDGSHNKLAGLEEYIKDTEEFINIELDSSRNRLIKFEILITTATFTIAVFGLVAGILGENVVIPPFIAWPKSSFWAINSFMFVFCVICFFVMYAYMRWRSLI